LLIFLQQKFANSEAIVRQTWERYSSNGGSITNAIDWAIKQYNVNSGLTEEFPKFTWNNYFMITGTYDINVTNVYTDSATLPPTFTGPEWKLFRSFLHDGREIWQAGNSGVLAKRVDAYPVDGSTQVNPQIGRFGAAYIEFYPPGGPAAQLNLTLTITKQWGKANPKVSVIPIANFQTHPPNNFINPVADTGLSLGYVYTYNNFNALDRLLVIISNVDGDINFSYSANITTP
jgi:hypothetical protein